MHLQYQKLKVMIIISNPKLFKIHYLAISNRLSLFLTYPRFFSITRLGALGFLATNDKAAAGNMGIHDQIMVLKWVQKNIEKFGGDAGKVTVFGEDAGAASVTILAMSPLANGLFHGAITLSGNALCDQYMQNDPNEAAVELANRLECSSEKGEDIVNCLSRQTQQDIIKASNSMAVSDMSFIPYFVR